MANDVRRNDSLSRYELLVDGDLAGVADFRLDGEVLVVPHTEIDASRRGQGLGAVLVKGLLEDVRQSGRTVNPQCWYVAQYLDDHPGEQDLRAP